MAFIQEIKPNMKNNAPMIRIDIRISLREILLILSDVLPAFILFFSYLVDRVDDIISLVPSLAGIDVSSIPAQQDHR